MDEASSLIVAHDNALRKRSLKVWTFRLTLNKWREVLLSAIVVVLLACQISDAWTLHDLKSKIIVSERIRDVDRTGQTIDRHGATYAINADPDRHKLVSDFLTDVFEVDSMKGTMQNHYSDAQEMLLGGSDAENAVHAYWVKHSPLRADGTWLRDLAIPTTVHVTSKLGSPAGTHGEEEWKVTFTLTTSHAGINVDEYYTGDLTLVPHGEATDADPSGMLVGEFSWDKQD